MEEAQNRPPTLPEPPAARETLKQEICFFVESLRERAEREGRYALRKLKPCSHVTFVCASTFKTQIHSIHLRLHLPFAQY